MKMVCCRFDFSYILLVDKLNNYKHGLCFVTFSFLLTTTSKDSGQFGKKRYLIQIKNKLQQSPKKSEQIYRVNILKLGKVKAKCSFSIVDIG